MTTEYDELLSVKAPKGLEASAGAVLEAEETLRQFDEEFGDGVAPRDKAVAVQEAMKGAKTGQMSPRMKQSMRNQRDAAAAGVDPKSAMDKDIEMGSDPVDAYGGLLSLVLPVLAGAAISGKRGAAAAVVGGGTQLLKEEEARQDRIEARRESDERLEQGKALAKYKNDLAKEGEKTEEEQRESDRLDLEMQLETKNRFAEQKRLTQEINDTEPLMARVDDMMKEAEAVYGNNTFLNQKVQEAIDQNSREALLKDRVTQLAFEYVKLQQGSRPSDFDVQALMKTIRGNQLTGPQGALARLKQLREDLRLRHKIRREQLANNGKLSAETQAAKDEYDSRQGSVSPEFSAALRIQKTGASRADVEKWFKEKTKSGMSPAMKEALDLIYGN